MTDPFDDLERALRAKVVSRTTDAATSPADGRGHGPAGFPVAAGFPEPAGPPNRRRALGRWLRRHGTPVAGVAAALSIAGGAFAGGALKGSEPERARGVRIAKQAYDENRDAHACHPGSPPKDSQPLTVVHDPLVPAIRAAMPWLETPQRAVDRRVFAQMAALGGLAMNGSVIEGTPHVIDLSAKRAVMVAVSPSGGWTSVTDPGACLALRVATAERLVRNESAATAEYTLRRVRRSTDVLVGAQYLSVTTFGRTPGGRYVPRFGTAAPVVPDGPELWRTVHTGVYGSLGAGEYMGFSGSAARRLVLTPKRRDRAAGVPRSVPVHRGFWNFQLPRRTGRVDIRAIDHAGRTVDRLHVR